MENDCLLFCLLQMCARDMAHKICGSMGNGDKQIVDQWTEKPGTLIDDFLL